MIINNLEFTILHIYSIIRGLIEVRSIYDIIIFDIVRLYVKPTMSSFRFNVLSVFHLQPQDMIMIFILFQ